MPEMDGLAFLTQLRQHSPEVPVIMMSGQATLETAVQATRMGALDFVEKPVGLDRLLLTLRNALRLDRLQRENRELQTYWRSEEHTSELQSQSNLVCRLLLEKKKNICKREV